jgi:DNA-directed RNA polymerase subunit RPC12/RpoP
MKEGEQVAGYIRKILVENGDRYEPFYIYQCVNCGHEVPESHLHTVEDNNYYCWDCSFLTNRISETEYLQFSGVYIDNAHAEAIDGKVIIYIGKNPPWIERTDKQERHSTQYQTWRKAVFERDNYTCQDCAIRGGTLNAHHIKSFKKYKDLRYDINNGITLCKKCHGMRHRKKVSA